MIHKSFNSGTCFVLPQRNTKSSNYENKNYIFPFSTFFRMTPWKNHGGIVTVRRPQWCLRRDLPRPHHPHPRRLHRQVHRCSGILSSREIQILAGAAGDIVIEKSATCGWPLWSFSWASYHCLYIVERLVIMLGCFLETSQIFTNFNGWRLVLKQNLGMVLRMSA